VKNTKQENRGKSLDETPPKSAPTPSGKTTKSMKSTHQRSPPRTKREQKGNGGGEGKGRRQPGPRTSGKLLAPGVRTGEGGLTWVRH
jgi:hypothetical protein